MTEWYQTPYKTGPLVAVKGFPRPLYPPDAAPKYKPSSNGPDVEAYKRTISRAGRWVWQAFDQTFSNAFAHGKSGNVQDTGLAGVQRQQGITDSGWIGEPTFNLLRGIIIPNGLPHAGEHAMDATSVELVNSAWEMFKGKDTPEPPVGTSAQARLRKATAEIGTTESPRNSNKTQYGQWYGMNGVPWCAIFATWADQHSAKPSKSLVRGRFYAYVPFVVADARNGWNGLSITNSPKPGDLVCYDWQRDGQHDHIGIFESGNSTQWVAVEGNTSVSDNSNGGQVMRRNRDWGQGNAVFVRVREP